MANWLKIDQRSTTIIARWVFEAELRGKSAKVDRAYPPPYCQGLTGSPRLREPSRAHLLPGWSKLSSRTSREVHYQISYRVECDLTPQFYPPREWGGPIPIPAPAQMGGLFQPWGPNSMVTQETGRFWEILGEPPNEAILSLRDPQNRTRDHDSVPKGPKISSYGPFSSHLVRISSQIEPFGPNPNQAT